MNENKKMPIEIYFKILSSLADLNMTNCNVFKELISPTFITQCVFKEETKNLNEIKIKYIAEVLVTLFKADLIQ